MNKGVFVSLAGAVLCVMAGQTWAAPFCLLLAWLAFAGSQDIQASETHLENNTRFGCWSVAVLVVAGLMLFLALAISMENPDGKFMAEGSILRALVLGE